MPLRFSANLNFLFTEGSPSLCEKIRLAVKAGFRAIEIACPINDKEQVLDAIKETGVHVALLNIAVDEKFKFGCASIPGAEKVFKEHLTDTINFAQLAGCKKIHIMSGTIIGTGVSESDYYATYKNNLKYAVNCLEEMDMVAVIEPINKYSLPSYFMNCYEKASSIIKEVDHDNLKLMVDIFHLQKICGNITNTFFAISNIIGHIQIAQVPHRHEPDVPGELDFAYIFSLIEKNTYSDWIGCEYSPKTTTLEGLKWIAEFNLKL